MANWQIPIYPGNRGSPPLFYRASGVLSFTSNRKLTKDSYTNNQKYTKFVKTIDGVPVRTLFVGNLHVKVTNRDLLNIFGSNGSVEKIDIIHSSKNERSKKGTEPKKSIYAFITFNSPSEASRAFRENQFLYCGKRRFYVNVADSWHQPAGDRPQDSREGNDSSSSVCDNKSESEEDPERDELEDLDEDDCPVTKLNDDCLHAIFSYIPINEWHVVGSICRRWRYITSMMWSSVRKLDFSKPPLDKEDLTLKTLRRYVTSCENLTSLNLSQDSHYLKSSAIATVAKACKHLEEIRFSSINLRNRSLALLARYCPNLKAFYMDGCSNCHDGEMIALITKCTQLQKIGMRLSMSLNGKWLKYLNGSLESLSLQMCEFTPTYLIEGLNNVKSTIKTLVFTSCISLRCSDLVVITEAVPNLTSLTVSGAFPDFKAHSLSPISRLTQLSDLNLEKNNVVCDEFIEDLLDHCPNIRYINLSGTEGSLLSSHGLCLVGKFPELVDLRLSYLTSLTDQVLKTIGHRATKLEHIDIVGCPSITDEGCCSLVSHCRSLKYIDLSGCNNITNKTLRAAVDAALIDNKKKKLTMVIGGSGIDLETDWQSPYITIDHRATCLPFMYTTLDDEVLILGEDFDNMGYPDPYEELYELDDWDGIDQDFESRSSQLSFELPGYLDY